MFPKVVAAIFLGAGCIGIQPAVAEPTVKADEIVQFFVKSKLGAERGLCIGTAQECDKNAQGLRHADQF
jgi:hypothetical protein